MCMPTGEGRGLGPPVLPYTQNALLLETEQPINVDETLAKRLFLHYEFKKA